MVRLDRDTEFRSGLMEQSMKDNGIRIKPKVKEHFGTQKEIFTSVILKLIRPMALVSILM